MNREILFRGKPMFRESNEFVYGYYKHGNIAGVETDFILPLPEYKNEINEVAVCPSTVGQYTGLTDRNGVKIFEGDILVCPCCMNRVVGCVCWYESTASFKVCTLYDIYDDMYRRYEELLSDYVEEGIVVGNIHDSYKWLKNQRVKSENYGKHYCGCCGQYAKEFDCLGEFLPDYCYYCGARIEGEENV